MAERIVVDTGPLIALARADTLDVARALPFDFIAPVEVQAELAAGGAAGHAAVNASFVDFRASKTPLNLIAVANLGVGEASVIQLALDEQIDLVCIDERKGRRAAGAVGLRVTGTLGLLSRAKALGIVSAVRPFIERLDREGEWFDPELVTRVLIALGE